MSRFFSDIRQSDLQMAPGSISTTRADTEVRIKTTSIPPEVWRRCVVHEQATLQQAMQAADEGKCHIAMMLDDAGRLAGILTDGDLRRAQLDGRPMDTPALSLAVRRPIVSSTNLSRSEATGMLRENKITHLPIVDEQGCMHGLTMRHVQPAEANDTWAVIMAGGFGKRLAPLTDDTPKPLLKVAGIPMIERIIRSLQKAGISRIVLSVFHMADQIREYCGDGSRWGVQIDYIQEDTPIGTAGALSLMTERPRDHLLVMNADVLTNLPFGALIDYHVQQVNAATMCVRELAYRLEYGVVKFDGPFIARIDEKPTHTFFINAGIYLFNASVLDMIPSGEYFDMPALFEKMVHNNIRPGAFPIRELWLDIGTHADFAKAQIVARAGKTPFDDL